MNEQKIIEQFNRIPLGRLDTPIEKISSLEDGVEIWVKRDDLTGLGLSGNKIRKLEYLLWEAKEAGADTLITCGGVQSNHARATALAGAKLGLKTHVLLRGADGVIPQGNLLLMHLVGANVHPCTPEEYLERDAHMKRIASDLRKEGCVPYIIPEGGSNALGCMGYVRACKEIADFERQKGVTFDSIVCAVGSGGTYAGLRAGTALVGLGARVLGVNVCDDAETFTRRTDGLLEELGDRLGLELPLNPEDTIIDGFVGPGYAVPTEACRDAIYRAASDHALILDPVYTGKAFAGLLAEPQGGRLGDRSLFIHTGGAFGLFPQAEAILT
ncbi:MAG: D-cysteine desulfhydrase [Myxococcales bacterium]|nr:D-cysteine desulfhydrase [Myxococcales bacterium]|tara:strand:+ start:944 stop:1927 length:984 start_codon:yes stop_codon:yes gene_type:complete